MDELETPLLGPESFGRDSIDLVKLKDLQLIRGMSVLFLN